MQIYDAGSKSWLREAVRGYLRKLLRAIPDDLDRDHVVDTLFGKAALLCDETSIGYRNVAYFHQRHEALQLQTYSSTYRR